MEEPVTRGQYVVSKTRCPALHDYELKQVAQGQYVVSDTRCPALSDCELE